MENKKILLITNQSNTVINFRKDLILYLQSLKNTVYVVSGDDIRKVEIEKLGVDFKCIKFNNRSKNPFSLISLKRKLKIYISKLKPDIVLTFQIKPNIIGTTASAKCGINNVFAFVEGLGDPFQPKSLLDKIMLHFIVALYRSGLKRTKLVYFLNDDDKKEFVYRKIVPAKKTTVIKGIGIDTDFFRPPDAPNDENNVLMISRLIKNKGIFEYCQIARKTREIRKDIVFYLCGGEGQIKIKDIDQYIVTKDIVYLGEVKDVRPILSKCKIYVSTSYREGFPRTIMEAMAMGKPTFASNVIGNKELVVDGTTGYLFEKQDIDGFSKKITEMIDSNQLDSLGRNARKICVQNYDSRIINKTIIEMIDSLLSLG